MKIRTFADQFYLAYLGDYLGASFTQDWALRNAKGERVWFILLGHPSVSVTFNVQIGTTSSGGTTASLFTNVTATADAQAAVLGYDAGQLTATKQYSSALVTYSAGHYSLLEIRAALRQEGAVTQHTSVLSITELLT